MASTINAYSRTNGRPAVDLAAIERVLRSASMLPPENITAEYLCPIIARELRNDKFVIHKGDTSGFLHQPFPCCIMSVNGVQIAIIDILRGFPDRRAGP